MLGPYVHIIRPKNIVIIALTQVIIYYFLQESVQHNLLLSGILRYLFIMDTCLIAASGFVINDIFDAKIDNVNKPKMTFIPHPISRKNAILYYLILVAIGCCISIYIAYSIQNLPLVLLYPASTLCLFMYSYKYKNSILIGNVLVSLFIAFVTGIVWIAEKETIQQMEEPLMMLKIQQLLIFFIVFSFLVNLMREIIKDIQDINGDKNYNLKTLPIVYGISSAVNVCVFIIVFTCIGLTYWMYSNPINLGFRSLMYLTLFIILPLVYVGMQVRIDHSMSTFRRVSGLLKWILLAGLGFIFVID